MTGYEILGKSTLNQKEKWSQWIISIIYKLRNNYKNIELPEKKIKTVKNDYLLEALLGKYIRRLLYFSF